MAAKANPTTVTVAVCIGMRGALVDAIAAIHDHVIVAPASPYFGSRDGMPDEAWEAHKAPIRDKANAEATALMAEALKCAAQGNKVTVYVDSMAFSLTDDKGAVIRWARIAQDDAWRQTGGLLRTMGAVVNHL